MTKKKNKTPQDFCIYCQRRFKSSRNLARHIITKHRETYAFNNLESITGYKLNDEGKLLPVGEV